jgi:hypothetical protein
MIPKVRLRGVGSPTWVRWVDNVPTWNDNNPLPLANLDCEGDFSILLLGKTFAGPVSETGSVHTAVETDRLAQARNWSACVHSFGGEGWTWDQHGALAIEATHQLKPDLVVAIVDDQAAHPWTVAGGTAWSFHHFQPDQTGLPNPLALPASLHTALFGMSRSYQYVVQHQAEFGGSLEPLWAEFADQRVAPIQEALQDANADLVLMFMPDLDHPFGHARDQRGRSWEEDPYRSYAYVDSWARRAKIRTVWLEDQMGEQSVETVRDGCCAFNDQGRARLAELVVQQALITKSKR